MDAASTPANDPLKRAFLSIDSVYDDLLTKGIEEVDGQEFSSAWEVMGTNYHAIATVFLVRQCRAAILAGSDQEDVTRKFFDFVFKFFGYRQIVLASDMFILTDPESDEAAAIAMINIAQQSEYVTRGKREAAIIGVSGLVHYSPERIAGLARLDVHE